MVNYTVDGKDIKINLNVTKNDDKKIGHFVMDVATNFNITKYEYNKVGEVRIEEDSDEF